MMSMPALSTVSAVSAVHAKPQRAEPPSYGATDGATLARWLSQTLDHVGRGMLLVTDGALVLHANRLARLALDGLQPLRIECGRLRGQNATDTAALLDALDGAMHRGLRRMLSLGQGSAAITVAVLPLGSVGDGAALVSLPHSRRTHDLAVQSFARQHGFTAAETSVLVALMSGRRPGDIAEDKGVRLSTVRTQIGQLRLKCGAHSIRELLDQVSALPPMLALVQ